jgi:hypothetical protein
MDKKEFKNQSEKLIERNDIEFLLQNFLKDKLNQLSSRKLSVLSERKLGEIQNNLALITAKYNRFKSRELRGELGSEEKELQFSQLIMNCILLKNEIIDESEFFNEDLPIIALNTTNPTLKNNTGVIEKIFDAVEDSYNKKVRDIDSTNILFLTIVPENQNYQAIDIFESLYRQQRIVERDGSFYLSNTNIKCSKNIEVGDKNDFFIPIVCVLNSMCLPKTTHLLRFLNYVKFYNIPTVFCVVYENDEKTCELILSLLESNGILVETLGGKFQVQEVSIKTKSGFQELVEKIFFECEILGLNF